MAGFLVTTSYKHGSKRGKIQPAFYVEAKSEYRLRVDFFDHQSHLEIHEIKHKAPLAQLAEA